MHRLAVAALLALSVAACHSSNAAGADGGPSDGGADARADAGDARAPLADASAEDEQIPPTSSEELTARARHLLEAISQDNPDLAVDIQFPRDAFVAARDSTDAAKVWEKRVSQPFKKHVHGLHKKKGMDRAQFVQLELGHSVVQQGVRRHEWKRPLWKVKHSRLVYVIDGKTYKIDIGEMMAWKGAWYVTRLRGSG